MLDILCFKHAVSSMKEIKCPCFKLSVVIVSTLLASGVFRIWEVELSPDMTLTDELRPGRGKSSQLWQWIEYGGRIVEVQVGDSTGEIFPL